jgi:ribosomal subunit interface protein
MALRVSGKNLNIGEALRLHIKTRIDLAVSKFSAGPVIGHVTIEPEGSGFRADCTLHLDSGMTLQVEAEAHEPYASFNRAADRIEERLRRYKRRIRNKHGMHEAQPDAGVEFPIALGPQVGDDADESGAAQSSDASAAVIAEPQIHLKEMSVSSAVLELDLTNAPVVIFRHAGDGRPNIVYRRADGNIGWIDSISS